jgi:hypothetical protein
MLVRRCGLGPQLVPALAVLGGPLAAGCIDAGSSNQKYEFVIRIHGDPGRPLAGVPLSRAGEKIAVSDARGTIVLAAHGQEGETLAFEVVCPNGHRSPSKPLSIVLRRLTERDRRPEYSVSCPPHKRTLVVAVRADNGPNLPVRYLGREVGRTDAAGAAHVLLETQAEDSIELTLDTSGQPGLRPTNPAARFPVSTRDELVSFNQSFELPKTKSVVFRKPVPRGPRRIDGVDSR